MVFTGLTLYSDLQSRLLSAKQEERDSVVRYQCFLSENFFGGQPVVLVPALQNKDGTPNDVVHIKIGTQEERPIHQLGDGMQSLIICTYPIVTETRAGTLFFLEEPDLCMHPSLQRSLLNILQDYHIQMGHQFFLTTHSNHMLDLVGIDEMVSVFSFSEIKDKDLGSVALSSQGLGISDPATASKARFLIRSTTHRDRKILAQLGVRPSATFLANATIWVEGVSDCSYLRAYMEAFVQYLTSVVGNKHHQGWQDVTQRLIQYKEDRHFAFVEYNGANLVHWCFDDDMPDSEGSDQSSGHEGSPLNTSSLCAQAIVVADGDIRNKTKGQRANRLHQQLDDRLIILPGKEIENLIPEALVKRQIIDDHKTKKWGTPDENSMNKITYGTYARLKDRRVKRARRNSQEPELLGIGKHLLNLGFTRYAEDPGTGTLKEPYKQDWGSPQKGIPAKIRACLKDESQSEQKTDCLPGYLTQDILWLCVCLFCHIARCNHDHQSFEKLKGLKKWIRDVQGQSNQQSENSHDSDDLPPWPIRDPADRQCLFSRYLAIKG